MIAATMPLLERDAVLADLRGALEAAQQGQGSVVALLGEAGIGKTSLVHQLASESRSQLRVLTGGCEALFTPRPLGLLFDVAADLGLALDQSRDHLFPAALAALRSRPTILIVEDVHWADRATLDLLKYIARRVSHAPLLVLLTYRDDEVRPDHPLITLLGELGPSARRLRLSPLSRDAVASLIGARSKDADEVHRLTGGNPFYVTELLASDDEGVPPTVRDAVLARAAKLSAEARVAIEVASLSPGRAELWLVRETARPSDDAIEEAVGSGIARIDNGALVFRHELARRAIEDSVSEIRRAPLHAKILQILSGRRVPLARLAHHAACARDVEAILRFAPLAAEEAAKASAHREAVTHYRNALEAGESLDDETRAKLIEALAFELYLTEQHRDALACRVEATAIWHGLGDRRREGDNLRWQSRLNWFLANNAAARSHAAAAIAVLEEVGESRELAMAYSNQAQLHMLAQETADAIGLGEKAIAMAVRVGDEEVLAHALNNVGAASALAQDPTGFEKLEQSLSIALAHNYQEHAARAYTNLASQAVRLHDERAKRYLDDGIAYSRDRDLDAWVVYMSGWRARYLLEHDDWDGAARDAHAVLSHRTTSAISRISALVALGTIRTRRGDPGAAALLDEARELALATTELQRLAPVACARAEAAWLGGDLAGAAEELRIAWELCATVGLNPERETLALWMWRAGAIDERPAIEPHGRYEEALALADNGDARSLQRAAALVEAFGPNALLDRLRKLGVRGPRASTRANPAGLTVREMEILELLDEGLRNADIADRLSVSAKTVDHHVSAVLAKLGVKSRGEAARVYRSQK